MLKISSKLGLATILIILFFLVGVIYNANADTILITPSTETQKVGPSGPPANQPTAEDIALLFGYSGTLEWLYKAEQGFPIKEEGSYMNSYTTIFDPTDDPENATITYDGSPDPFITGSPLYLLVKDGASSPNWYVFDLLDLKNVYVNSSLVPNYSWNGTDTLQLNGFWPTQGAISNVAILGPKAVPEPSTLLLLGAGLLGMGVLGRKFRGKP